MLYKWNIYGFKLGIYGIYIGMYGMYWNIWVCIGIYGLVGSMRLSCIFWKCRNIQGYAGLFTVIYGYVGLYMDIRVWIDT